MLTILGIEHTIGRANGLSGRPRKTRPSSQGGCVVTEADTGGGYLPAEEDLSTTASHSGEQEQQGQHDL